MRRLLDKTARRILTRLFIIIFTSIIIMFFIEWRFFDNNINRTWQFVGERFLVFSYNVLLLFFIELVVSALFKTPWTGAGITFILAIIFSYISSQKQSFRGQPLLPEDFMLTDQAGTISKFIDMGSLVRMILACLIAFGSVLLLNYLTKHFFDIKDRKEPKRFWNKNLRIFRLTILLIGAICFVKYTEFIRNHNGERAEDIPQLNSQFVAWNQMQNYEDNGFIIGFMYNWSKFEMKAPDGYSEEKIAEIKSLYENTSTTENIMDYNIIVVLNESFFDPSVISEYYPISANNVGGKNSMGVPITKDVTPTIRNLIKNDKKSNNYATGQMYTIDYGGGTANIEYEVDTAMTNYWANTVPFVDLYPHIDYVPSIAQIAKKAGYKTLAIHPFNSGMYKRNFALPKEGIDGFIDENQISFKDCDDNRQYINDRSAYNETIKAIEDSDKKTFISLVTMQNHAGYGDDGYSSYSYSLGNAPKTGDLRSEFTEDERKQYEVYLETLHNSDYYLSEFLGKLEKMNEKTVVLWYGDHAPGVIGRVNDSKDKDTRDLSRVTPYFIWANFELKNVEYKDIKRFNQTKTTLPTTTPNCLTNTMLDLLGLEKPDYMKLVNDVCKEVPILAQAYYGSGAPFKSTTLSNYEIFTYDILGGEQYWLK